MTINVLTLLMLLAFQINKSKVFADEERKKAVLHLGPGKTGTTHIQQMLANEAKLLQTKGFYNLGTCGNSQSQFSFFHYLNGDPIDIRKRRSNCEMTANEIEDFFRIRKENNENIIFSSELFTFLEKTTALIRLSEMLKEYDVTIVFYYRNYVSRKISLLNQFAKFKARRWSDPNWPKVVFYEDFHKDTWANQATRVEDIINVYKNVFPNASITVVDFFGTLEAGHDLSDPIFCDIIKTFCVDGKADYEIKKVPGNSNESLEKEQMVELFHEFVVSQHCFFDIYHLHPLKEYHWGHLTIPYKDVNLEEDIFFSLLIDDELRKNYELIYGDKAVNEKIIASIEYIEVDRNVIENSPNWKNQFMEAFKLFKDKGIIIC